MMKKMSETSGAMDGSASLDAIDATKDYVKDIDADEGEIAEGSERLVNGLLSLPLLDGYRVVKEVTVPQCRLETGQPYFFKVTGALTRGESREPGREAPYVLPIFNLVTERAEVIYGLPAVVRSSLVEGYPGETYVGRKFGLVMGGENRGGTGRKYRTCMMQEIANQ